MPLPLSKLQRSLPVSADLTACQDALRSGSRSFFVAAMLLPRAIREPACALYAFCRMADDAIDQQHGGVAAVAQLRMRLDALYARAPWPHAVDRALADVVEQFRIPRALLDALIEGFEWDAEGRRYEDLAALQAYAVRVAGTVGAMMALLMGVRDPVAIARACDLGVAMQLTNIARDVGEDARNGRLYLPLSWLSEAGLDADRWLAAPHFNPPIAAAVARLLQAAECLYARVDRGVAVLPASCQPGINAARFFYAAIGHEVASAGFDSISRRAVVPARRKLYLLLRAFLSPLRLSAAIPAPPLAASEYLVTAAVSAHAVETPIEMQPGAALPWWYFRQRFIRLLAIFERLERADRSNQMARLAARS